MSQVQRLKAYIQNSDRRDILPALLWLSSIMGVLISILMDYSALSLSDYFKYGNVVFLYPNVLIGLPEVIWGTSGNIPLLYEMLGLVPLVLVAFFTGKLVRKHTPLGPRYFAVTVLWAVALTGLNYGLVYILAS